MACLFYISHLPNYKLETEMTKKKHVSSARVLHLTAYELRTLESSGIRWHGISKDQTAFTSGSGSPSTQLVPADEGTVLL